MTNRFTDKVVVITGAGGGIGRAAAIRFAEEGAAVIAVDRDRDPAEETRAQLETFGHGAVAIAADVALDHEVEGVMEQAVGAFGGIDVIFNNAGIEGAVAPLESYPEDVFDQVMAVNVKGVWLGMKHGADRLRQRGGGAIVNTASVAGLTGTAHLIAYGASKHAVIGMTKTAATELAAAGIRVNAVCPAPIETRMMRSIEAGVDPDDPEAIHKTFAKNIPLGRYGEADEVAALVAFLASDDASYISGAAYPVDGGRMAR